MAETKIIQQKVDVTFSRHDLTGLWSAQSDDLHGFMIFGKSFDELLEQVGPSLRALLEAEGRQVVHVERVDEEAASHWHAPRTHAQVDIRYAA